MARFAVSISSGTRFKEWSRAIYALSRISEKILIEVKADRLRLCSSNSTRSAFAFIKFTPSFFEKYKFRGSPNATNGNRSTAGSRSRTAESVTVELQTKFFVPIFKRHEKDSTLERCDMHLDNTGNEWRLVVTIHCRYGILKSYRLSYEVARAYDVLHSIDDYPNTFAVKAKVLQSYVEHTSGRAEVFSMKFLPDEVVLSSFTDMVSNSKNEVLKQPLQTSIHVNCVEFNDVIVDDQMEAVFSLREFRAFVSLADVLDCSITGSFGSPTEPIVFECDTGDIKTTVLLFTGDATAETVRATGAPAHRLTVRPQLARREVSPNLDMDYTIDESELEQPAPTNRWAEKQSNETVAPTHANEATLPRLRKDFELRVQRERTISQEQSPPQDEPPHLIPTDRSRQGEFEESEVPATVETNMRQELARPSHSSLPTQDTLEKSFLPPPLLPRLLFTSPFVARNKTGIDSESNHNNQAHNPESDSSDIVVWNETSHAMAVLPQEVTAAYVDSAAPDARQLASRKAGSRRELVTLSQREPKRTRRQHLADVAIIAQDPLDDEEAETQKQLNPARFLEDHSDEGLSQEQVILATQVSQPPIPPIADL
ncbi:Rad9-domain-containing protein [Limtongia smithiae]|uniref:Rad9-domain-containing protein n=1 Tax=Limtongia smithiae TaxID=1125753 RepID=UPI0034CF5086